MMRFQRQLSAAIALLCCCSLTACGSSRQDDVPEENLPYGATMKTETEGFSIPLEFDRRFFADAEAVAVDNYFYSIQTKDTDLYTACTLDAYTDYTVDAMYQGLIGTDGLVIHLNDTFAQEAEGTDFTFTKITIKECETKSGEFVEDGGTFEGLFYMLDTLEGDEQFSTNHISDGKYLSLEITMMANGVMTVVDRNLYVICVDGEYSVCA